MKFIRKITLLVGLIFMLLALTIMFKQTFGRNGVSSEPVYMREVPEVISKNQN